MSASALIRVPWCNQTPPGTSQSVTGLTGGVTYYYRVRAEGAGGCTSTNSSTNDVTTTLLPPGTPGPYRVLLGFKKMN